MKALRGLRYAIALTLLSLTVGCQTPDAPIGSTSLNSRYNDEQPALSGDGRWLAFVSNRNGRSEILVYDRRQKRFVQLPGLLVQDAIAQSPSLSLTGRYMTYLINNQGRADLALYDRAIGRSQILSGNYRSWIANPKISPNGRYIVFESARKGQWDIEVLDRGPEIELDIPEGSPVN
ncbi:PD40 domain-containing protein [Oscillatoria sp. FACHB-1406]|uniref:TolB family protein n=1 Tax=Oscillatoria sp. FACHB-1406 TaxID=2692846 RepID=UPI0016879149|nr:PD40 domain-containing protein [Oscillatoria sp. FACHB-1406]MBD2578861.1 TolB family protein [Oscillatoria sp. FACHB-1406]